MSHKAIGTPWVWQQCIMKPVGVGDPEFSSEKCSRNPDFCENLILLLLKIDYADPKLFLTAPEEICYQSPEDQDPN